ncbi:MAG TPA: hypothetical protein VMU53_18375 [Candidatus Sulfotelmatobacter sp.]|nr:hypothetical protein [Candidatus Sulfotelmatobacter sp.]
MRRAALYLALLLCATSFRPGRAQDCEMIPAYSMYFGAGNGSSGNSILTFVEVEGYANIYPTDCALEGVTHQGSAYNDVDGVGNYWESGSAVCPSCYVYVLDYQTLQATPGVSYPWNYQAKVVCSQAGTIFNEAGQQKVSLVLPTGETSEATTNGALAPEVPFIATLEGGSFNGHQVQESSGGPGVNNCYWSGAPIPQYPVVQGTSWTVGTVNNQAAGANQYGYDTIGWNAYDLNAIATTGAAQGIKSGCVTEIYQFMEYWFPGVWDMYKYNLLTFTATWPPQEQESCRDEAGQGECGSN